MKIYQSADLPFKTQNVICAFCLYLGGVKFADEKKPLVNIYDGKILTGLGYTGDIESNARAAHIAGKRGAVEYGFSKKNPFGQVLQAHDEYAPNPKAVDTRTARVQFDAVTRRLAGGELSPFQAIAAASCVILKRWREEERSWSDNETYSATRRKNAVGKEDCRRVCEVAFLKGEFFAFAACIMDAREAFLNFWKGYRPTVRMRVGSEPTFRDHEFTTKRGKVMGKIGKHPGFIAYSTNAENDIRRKLGAPLL